MDDKHANQSKSAAAVKTWNKNTKDKIIAAMGGCCVICGYNKTHSSLHLHHLDPKTKKFSISFCRSDHCSWKTIVSELRKCVLLCKNCHTEVHCGMISIPENAASFNEEYSNYKMSNLEKAKAFQDKSKNKKTLAQAMFERRKVERPSIEELNKMLWEMPTTKIAKLYGVSDKAIEKWAKGYELTKPPPGYWQKLAAGKIINNEQI